SGHVLPPSICPATWRIRLMGGSQAPVAFRLQGPRRGALEGGLPFEALLPADRVDDRLEPAHGCLEVADGVVRPEGATDDDAACLDMDGGQPGPGICAAV